MATFTNQARLAYNNSVTNSNIAIGEILEVLSATKTAVRNDYGQNDSVTYIISIVNAGTTPVTGLTVTDDLGTYAFGTGGETRTPLNYVDGTVQYYNNGTLQTAPAVTAGPTLTFSNITVPAGGNATIVYEAAVNQFAPIAAGGEITNTAQITGAGLTPITVEETVTASAEPLLTITKSVSPVPVTENGRLTYTFVIQNTGNAEADAGSAAVISDTFDPILENLVVTFNGTTLVEGTDYTYNQATGEFATIAGRVTVPAATFTQDPTSGDYLINPGVSTLVISGDV